MCTRENRGGSNEYLQSMFWIKNKKSRYIPVNPSFKVGFKGVYISRTCFHDVSLRCTNVMINGVVVIISASVDEK